MPENVGSKLTRTNQREGNGKGAGALALHHLILYQNPPLSHLLPLIDSSQLGADIFRYLYPSTPILRSTPRNMELPVTSETSALKTQTPGHYPKDTIRSGHFLRILTSFSCKEFVFSHRLILAMSLTNNCPTNSGMKI